MSTIEEDLQSAKLRLESAQRAQTKAQIALENAIAQKSEAMTLLESEFGVTTVAEGNKLLKKMQKALEAELAEASKALDEAS